MGVDIYLMLWRCIERRTVLVGPVPVRNNRLLSISFVECKVQISAGQYSMHNGRLYVHIEGRQSGHAGFPYMHTLGGSCPTSLSFRHTSICAPGTRNVLVCILFIRFQILTHQSQLHQNPTQPWFESPSSSIAPSSKNRQREY